MGINYVRIMLKNASIISSRGRSEWLCLRQRGWSVSHVIPLF